MNRLSFLRIAGTGALATLLAACAPKDPRLETTTALADGVLLPTYQAWAETDRQLADSASAFCSDQQNLEQARQAFLQAQRAWAGLQPMLIGPLDEGNLTWQVQFWPDKKNLVARQATALLKKNPTPTRADIENASVALQGLGAYEYLLFDPNVDLQDSASKTRHCALLTAIGEHQRQLSADVLDQWQGENGMAARLKSYPNERYADANEALGDLLRVHVTALDSLKKKLGLPLGRPGKGVPQPYQAEAWRSGQSLSNIAATVEGAERLWQGAQEDGLRQLVAEQGDLAQRIDAAYARVREQLDGLPQQPIAELLASEQGQARLNTLYDNLDALHRLHQSELAKTLGVQIGFNANDGD